MAEEDSLMQQDNIEESQDSPAAGEWIMNVSRAQRRRGRRQLSQTNRQPPRSSPQEGKTRPPSSKRAPRPLPLPLDDYKLVLRPRNGLNVGKLAPSELSLALLQATNTTWRQANFKLRIDQNQNTATISTPSKEVAAKLFQVTKIKIEETEHPVELYGLAPDDAVKGVIQGVPKHLSIQEIKDNILQDGFEIYTVRRMGKDSTTVLLTFSGPEVPHYVWLYGAEYRCTLHKKTVAVCEICYEVGHRSTACPQPGAQACHGCGLRDPAPDHPCVAKCTLCGGDHVTAAKGCPERYLTPYIIRQRKRLQQRRAQFIRDQTPSRGKRNRSATPSGFERSSSKHPTMDGSSRRGRQSRSRSRINATGYNRNHSRSKSTTRSQDQNEPKQVSWAQRVSSTAHSQTTPSTPPTLTQNPTGCMECKHLSQLLEQQNALIASLRARLDKLEQTQVSPNEKRKKPNPTTPEVPPSTAGTKTQPPPPPQVQDMFSELGSRLSSISQELQNIRQENQLLQQEFKSLRSDHTALRQEIATASNSSTALDHTYERQERSSKGPIRTHSRSVPYSRTPDNLITATLPDGRDPV